MKLSVSIGDTDVEFLDRCAALHGSTHGANQTARSLTGLDAASRPGL